MAKQYKFIRTYYISLRYRREHYVRVGLREMGFEVMDCIHMAYDVGLCRTLVNVQYVKLFLLLMVRIAVTLP